MKSAPPGIDEPSVLIHDHFSKHNNLVSDNSASIAEAG